MLVDLKRTVAYICPVCSNLSSKKISVFDFSGDDRLDLICPTHGCHEECAVIAVKGDKYNIAIECPLCGDRHTYTSKQASFWNKKLLTYKCSAAAIDIFFAGEKDEVQQAINDSVDIEAELFQQDIFDNLSPTHSYDFSLMLEIRGRIDELTQKKRIHCRCGSDKIEKYVDDDIITLQCTHCRRVKTLEVSNETLTRLLNASQIII